MNLSSHQKPAGPCFPRDGVAVLHRECRATCWRVRYLALSQLTLLKLVWPGSNGWHASSDEVRHQTNEIESPTLHGFLLSHPIRSPRHARKRTDGGMVRSRDFAVLSGDLSTFQ